MSKAGENASAIEVRPIGWVHSDIQTPQDDQWKGFPSVIELDSQIATEAIQGLEEFSHLEIVFHFHLVEPDTICSGSRHPRHQKHWPEVGIFAQRAKRRPNGLAVSRCRLERIDGRKIHVLDLDAVDGSPVLDIKPYMRETAPIGDVRQPEWSEELMRHYYDSRDAT